MPREVHLNKTTKSSGKLARLRLALLAGVASTLVAANAGAAVWNTDSATDNNWLNDANWVQLNLTTRNIHNASVVMNGGATTASTLTVGSADLTVSGGASIILNGDTGGGGRTTSILAVNNAKYCIANAWCEPANSAVTVQGEGTRIELTGPNNAVRVEAGNDLSSSLTLSDGAVISTASISAVGSNGGVSTINIGAAQDEQAKAAGNFEYVRPTAVTVNTGKLALSNATLVLNHTDDDYVLDFMPFTSGTTQTGSVIRVLNGTTTFAGTAGQDANGGQYYGGYLDSTIVSGGTLLVTGDHGGTINVSGTGTLGGTGKIGHTEYVTKTSLVGGKWVYETADAYFATTIGSGGTLAPGLVNEIGTLTVAGDLNLQSGSTYRVRIGENGISDQVLVGGDVTIDNGAKLAVAYDGNLTYRTGWKYYVLSYDGELNGRFDDIADSVLLSYNLDYSQAGKVGLGITVAGDDGDVAGDWFVADSWSDGVVPEESTAAVIEAGRDIFIDNKDATSSKLTMGTANGGGTLTIRNGGTLTSGEILAGNDQSGASDIIVTGSGSTLIMQNPANGDSTSATFGNAAKSSLTISDGGVVEGGKYMYFKNDSTLTVTGSGSALNLTGSLGSIEAQDAVISDGGVINVTGSSGIVYVGRYTAGDYKMLVTGEGSTVNATAFTIGLSKLMGEGDVTKGTVTLADSGKIRTIGLGIASQANTVGTLNIGAAEGEAAAAAGILENYANPSNPANYYGITFGTGTGALVFNHEGTEFNSNIRKTGTTGTATIKQLAGDTLYSGDGSGFTGTTDISGGALYVTNKLAGTFNVSGGALGGTGVIGTASSGTDDAPVSGSVVTIANGGVLTPGLADAIGTLTVAGDLTFEEGSAYKVRIAEDGISDSVDVGGNVVIKDGAKMAVVYDSQLTYQDDWSYRVLTYGGTLDGAFDKIEDSVLLSYDLTNNADAKALDLAIKIKEAPTEQPTEQPTEAPTDAPTEQPTEQPTEAPTDAPTEQPTEQPTEAPTEQPTDTPVNPGATLEQFAVSPNQLATSQALDKLGQSSALWLAVASTPDEETVRNAFDQLSGAEHASAKAALIEDSHFIRGAINDRIRNAFENVASPDVPVLSYGPDIRTPKDAPFIAAAPVDAERAAFWTSAFGSWGKSDGRDGVSDLDRSVGGFVVGVDAAAFNDWRFGVIGGYSRSNFDTSRSDGQSDNYHLGAYAGARWDALSFRSGLAYSWHDVSSSRNVHFNTQLGQFTDTLLADYDAHTLQVYGELGYEFNFNQAALEPYVNLAHVRLKTDGFTENGGLAALSVDSDTVNTTFTTLGLRTSTKFTMGSVEASARGGIGWQHAFGDTSMHSLNAFASGSDTFTVSGVPIARNAAVIEAGVDFKLSPTSSLGVSYQGQFGSNAHKNGVNALLKVGF